MKHFHRMILRAWVGPFVMSFSILLFILVMQFISIYQDDIFGKGLSGGVVLQLFAFAAARMVIMATPVAILAASLMTFGGMGEHYELAAAKACGVGVFRIAAPMTLVAGLLTLMLMWFSFELMPRANLKFFTLLYDVQRKKADFAITPGYFYSDIDGYVIRASRKDAERGILYDLIIYDYTSKAERPAVVMADSARSQSTNGGRVLKMLLFHGTRHEDVAPESGQANTFRYSRVYFDSLYYFLPLKGFDLTKTDETMFKHQITSTLGRLKNDLDSLRGRSGQTTKTYRSYLSPYVHVDSVWPAKVPQAKAPAIPQPITDSASAQLLTEARLAKTSVVTTFASIPKEKIYNTALGNIRAVKNYTEFMRKRRDDEQETLNRYLCEYHKRFAMPFNCLFFMLIGVSLGAVIRKGGMGLPSLISIVMLVVLYLLDAQGKKLAKEGAMDPILGAWLTAIVFAPLSIWFTWQAASDVQMIDSNRWYEFRDWVKKKVRLRTPKRPQA